MGSSLEQIMNQTAIESFARSITPVTDNALFTKLGIDENAQAYFGLSGVELQGYNTSLVATVIHTRVDGAEFIAKVEDTIKAYKVVKAQLPHGQKLALAVNFKGPSNPNIEKGLTKLAENVDLALITGNPVLETLPVVKVNKKNGKFRSFNETLDQYGPGGAVQVLIGRIIPREG